MAGKISSSSRIKCLFILVLSATLLTSSCTSPKKNSITIATASSLQYVMEELTLDFKERTGIDCVVIVGSSGKLTAQIMQGAPYNLFLSADMKYPVFVHENGMGIQSPEIYAYGRLVLWSTDSELEPELNNLLLPSVEKIAIANPKTAPFGQAGIELLKRNDLLDSVEKKLVYGESIAQANQFITTGACELGFTSLSSVMAEPLKGIGKWAVVDKENHLPIPHGAIVLDRGFGQNVSASKFYSYLFSEEATEILEEFGYSRNE